MRLQPAGARAGEAAIGGGGALAAGGCSANGSEHGSRKLGGNRGLQHQNGRRGWRYGADGDFQREQNLIQSLAPT